MEPQVLAAAPPVRPARTPIADPGNYTNLDLLAQQATRVQVAYERRGEAKAKVLGAKLAGQLLASADLDTQARYAVLLGELLDEADRAELRWQQLAGLEYPAAERAADSAIAHAKEEGAPSWA